MTTGEFSNPLTLTSQFSFCGMPLRLDSYAGCAFQCTYCFARYRGGHTFGEQVRPADPGTVDRIFRRALDSTRSVVGVIAQFLRRRTPVHVGGMSDPFQPAELRHHVTESVLNTLTRYRYPTVISTRSTLPATSTFIRLLEEIRHVVIQFSFSTTRDDVARRFEPHSSAPSALLKAMESLSRRGLNVTARWQPYIPGISEPAEEFIGRVGSSGCRHVGFEHLKLPFERSNPLWQKLNTAIGPDLAGAYRGRDAHRDGREFMLPPRRKLQTSREVAGIVRRHGMTFGSADNDLQYLSDTACCCSGVDQFDGFGSFFKHQIAYAIRQCRGQEILYGSIAREWCPTGSIDRYLNSHSRLSTRSDSEGSLQDHIVARWDNPGRPGSPTSFYGVVPRGRTCSGHVEYGWSDDSQRWLAAVTGGGGGLA